MAAAASPPAPPLLDGDDVAFLARLDLVQRRPTAGLHPGARRSRRSSRSPEFADFRPYVPGDDVRQVDWRAFARLERLVLRLSVAEEEVALNIVVDDSESMALGSPPKWPAARRLAAALAVLGLGAMDRAAVGGLGSGASTPHLRRGAGLARVVGFLTGAAPGGACGPAQLVGLRWLRPGLTVVVSDFMVEGSWAPALAALRHARQDVVLWQVLAPDEERPEVQGDVRLVEAESGRREELTITRRLVQEYLQALAEHRDGLRRQAASAQGRFVHTSSADPLQVSMRAGSAAGVVRRR